MRFGNLEGWGLLGAGRWALVLFLGEWGVCGNIEIMSMRYDWLVGERLVYREVMCFLVGIVYVCPFSLSRKEGRTSFG